MKQFFHCLCLQHAASPSTPLAHEIPTRLQLPHRKLLRSCAGEAKITMGTTRNFIQEHKCWVKVFRRDAPLPTLETGALPGCASGLPAAEARGPVMQALRVAAVHQLHAAHLQATVGSGRRAGRK